MYCTSVQQRTVDNYFAEYWSTVLQYTVQVYFRYPNKYNCAWSLHAVGCQFSVQCSDLYTKPTCPGPTWKPLTRCEGDYLRFFSDNLQTEVKIGDCQAQVQSSKCSYYWIFVGRLMDQRSRWTWDSATSSQSTSPSASLTTSTSSSRQTRTLGKDIYKGDSKANQQTRFMEHNIQHIILYSTGHPLFSDWSR